MESREKAEVGAGRGARSFAPRSLLNPPSWAGAWPAGRFPGRSPFLRPPAGRWPGAGRSPGSWCKSLVGVQAAEVALTRWQVQLGHTPGARPIINAQRAKEPPAQPAEAWPGRGQADVVGRR